jgi:hypothetical protein
MWLLESAEDRILGVDTLGEQVLSCIQYGTTCLLIRNIIGSVSCSDEWGLAWYFTQAHMVQEGAFAGETLALQVGSLMGKS